MTDDELKARVEECCTAIARGDASEAIAAILWAVLEEHLAAADTLAQKVEWAYDDAIFTAPEDTERMNRQWRVMMDALRDYRELRPVA